MAKPKPKTEEPIVMADEVTPEVTPEPEAPAVEPTPEVSPIGDTSPTGETPAKAPVLILGFVEHEIDSIPDQNGVRHKIPVRTPGLVPAK